ncbi:hypothetical protein DMB95_01060 [Campylobacter sp. MIT 12-8780]|uniref:hypothetical protein n=1 Tax=unclassified Campylobacter TaxID=2593542 RepID=UPI00115C4EB3|nr:MULTISPECIES: hypothetical protein [unclassified Campylobacter]TQR43121.1 hypothetical protein DMB95_01060 [Campylobacter sp. MIT 12-8780]
MDTSTILMSLQNKLPRKNPLIFTDIKEKFEALNEGQKRDFVSRIALSKLGSPTLTFWIGSFLFGAFGVGFFMAGAKKLGFIWLGITIVNIIIASLFVEPGSVLDKFTTIIPTALWVTSMVEAGKILRKNNHEKIMQALEESKKV